MKILTIIITKDNVFEDVSLASAYTGAKTDDDSGVNFNRIATIDADNNLLSRFWIQACGIVTDKLKSFIMASEINENSIKLTLELSGAYDDSMSPSVEKDVFSAMTAGVTAQWFAITFPERTKEWDEKSAALLNRAFAKLCHRRRPKRAETNNP